MCPHYDSTDLHIDISNNNPNNIEKLYIEERTIEGRKYVKIASTEYPILKAIEHVILGFFTNFNYLSGSNAFHAISNLIFEDATTPVHYTKEGEFSLNKDAPSLNKKLISDYAKKQKLDPGFQFKPHDNAYKSGRTKFDTFMAAINTIIFKLFGEEIPLPQMIQKLLM